MKLHRIALACFALSSLPAMAFTCNVVVTSVTTTYSPTDPIENLSTGTYSVMCTRVGSDPASLTYTLAANNGLQAGGGSNRVQFGGPSNRYSYELYRLSPYTSANRWQLSGTSTLNLRFEGTLSFGAVGTAAATVSSGAMPFTVRVPGSQPAGPAGAYTDTVGVVLRDKAAGVSSADLQATPATFLVTVNTLNTCEISTPPGAINFSYTSFQTTAATASTTFYTRCTTGLPYSVAVDTLPASPASLDLVYSLGLTPVTSPTSPATGSGLPQLFTITGTMPAGQSGTCASATCTATQPRTITITY
jgi:Spore Coat Protein U domain